MKFLLLLLAASLAISACTKKEDTAADSNPYYIKFTAAGKTYKLVNNNIFASFEQGHFVYDGSNTHGFYTGLIGNTITNAENPYALFVRVRDTVHQIKAGTYFALPTDKFRAAQGMEMGCILPVNDINVRTKFYTGYRQVSLSITEMTIDYVKGQFSGTVYEDITTEANGIIISGGEFYLKRAD